MSLKEKIDYITENYINTKLRVNVNFATYKRDKFGNKIKYKRGDKYFFKMIPIKGVIISAEESILEPGNIILCTSDRYSFKLKNNNVKLIKL